MSHLQQEKKIMNKKITLYKLKKITKKIKPIKNYDAWYKALMINLIREIN